MKKLLIIMMILLLSGCTAQKGRETLVCSFNDLHLNYNDAKTNINYTAQALDQYITEEDIIITVDLGTDDVEAYIKDEGYVDIKQLFESIQTDAMYYLNIYSKFFDFTDAPTDHKIDENILTLKIKSMSPKRKTGILGSIPPVRYNINQIQKTFESYPVSQTCTITKG